MPILFVFLFFALGMAAQEVVYEVHAPINGNPLCLFSTEQSAIEFATIVCEMGVLPIAILKKTEYEMVKRHDYDAQAVPRVEIDKPPTLFSKRYKVWIFQRYRLPHEFNVMALPEVIHRIANKHNTLKHPQEEPVIYIYYKEVPEFGWGSGSTSISAFEKQVDSIKRIILN